MANIYASGTVTASSIFVNNGTYGGVAAYTGTSASNFIVTGGSTVSINVANPYYASGDTTEAIEFREVEVIPKKVDLGTEFEMEMPDGTKLKLNADGNFSIDDKDAKVTYKSNNQRAFNKYVNASDLIVEFIEDLKKMGLPQDRVLAVPMGVFINWLMVRSAEADGEPPAPDVPKLETRVELQAPRCGCCGRYIPVRNERVGLRFCNGEHADRALARISHDS